MTDYEMATLRLEAWKAISGWGRRNPNATDPIERLVDPWDWEERMRRADELATWATGEEKASST
jgi:hypothetical protein